MKKYRIVKQLFMTSSTIIAKGFLDRETADKECKGWNQGCDVYTHYFVECYGDKDLIKFENIKLNLK